MGLVNTVVPLAELEATTRAVVPGDARALAVRPAAAQGQLPRLGGRLRGHPAVRARYEPAVLRSPEAQEGRDAFKEKRSPDFDQFPRRA